MLLVGENNPYGNDPRYALYCLPLNSAGGRLQRLVLGLRFSRYLELERVNLCSGKWSVPAARAAAALYAPTAERVPVLLGAKVSAAFGVPFVPFTRTEMGVVLPHPSGRCTIWNEPGSVARARAVLAEVFPDVPFGEIERVGDSR